MTVVYEEGGRGLATGTRCLRGHPKMTLVAVVMWRSLALDAHKRSMLIGMITHKKFY